MKTCRSSSIFIKGRGCETGNILFLILLAVVLFAALSIAVTNALRGGGKDSSSESYETQASAILQVFNQIDTAVTRMTLTGGLSIENISFEYPNKTYGGGTPNSYANTNCNSDTCRVFKPSGGGVTPTTFEKMAIQSPTGWSASSPMPGYFEFMMMRWPYAGTDANDIVIRYSAMPPALCTEIANSLDLPASANVSGPFLNIVPVISWDSTLRYITGDTTPFLGKNIIVLYSNTNNYCQVLHLVYSR